MWMMALFFILFFNISSTIYAAPSAPESPPKQTSDQSEDEEKDDQEKAKWYELDKKFDEIKGYFSNVEENLDQIVENIKMFFEGGLTGILERTLGSMMESFFTSVSGLINKWVFLTPNLIEYTWIRKLWWISYSMAIMLFGTGVGFTFINYLRGKKHLTSKLFTALLIGFIGTTFSLLISDLIIQAKNTVINSLVQDTLYEAYQEGLKNSWMLVSGLTKEEMSFDAFTGLQISKMIFGGQIGNSEELYKLFLSAGGIGGGLITMIWAMADLSIIGLFGIVRHGVLGILGAGAPFWFMLCAFTGDPRPAAGWMNIYGRSVVLTIIFDIAWIFSVYINKAGGNEFAGMGQQIISCILFTIALIVAIKFWLVWVKRALANPLTLAGDQAMEVWQKGASKFGSGVEATGKRYGAPGLQQKGAGMKKTAEERQKMWQERMRGPQHKQVRNERLQKARSQGTKDFLKDNEDIKLSTSPVSMETTKKEVGYEFADKKDGDAVYKKLTDEFGKEHIKRDKEGYISMWSEYEDHAMDIIENYQESIEEKDVDFTAYDQKAAKPRTILKYNFQSPEQVDDVEDLLQSKLTSKAMINREQDGKVSSMVVSTLNSDVDQVAIEKVLKEYEKRKIYWKTGDGYYYYYDKEVDRLIKNLTPPKDGGRYMGSWRG